MRLSELSDHREALRAQLADPEFRDEWDRTAFARAVAQMLVAYRAERGLTQTRIRE
jgi:hypothetical protein